MWLVWNKRKHFLLITLIIGTGSFILNIGTIHHQAVATFYSPQTRFWELLSGSILAYICLYWPDLLSQIQNKLKPYDIATHLTATQSMILNNIQSFVGTVLIIVSLFVITKERSFPGWWALLPVGGAVLIISAGKNAWLNRKVLSHSLLVWFGLISFPLYLWHWPILSFARIMESETPARSIRIMAVLLSVVLAWLTYKLIERPIRFGKKTEWSSVIMLFLMVIVGFSGYTCFKQDGFPYRFKEFQEFADYYENSVPALNYNHRIGLYAKFRLECDFYDLNSYLDGKSTPIPLAKISRACFVKNNSLPNRVLIWGDSHAQQLYFGLQNNLPKDWQILQVATSSCPPNTQISQPSKTSYCDQSNWFAMKTIRKTKPDVVIIGQNLGHDSNNFKFIAKELKKLGVKKIIFTGPTPHWTSDLPKIILKKFWKNTPKRTYQFIDQTILAANTQLQQEAGVSDRYTFVNLFKVFCNSEGCLTYLGHDKKTGLMSYDYGHLTPVASDYLAKKALVPLVIEAV